MCAVRSRACAGEVPLAQERQRLVALVVGPPRLRDGNRRQAGEHDRTGGQRAPAAQRAPARHLQAGGRGRLGGRACGGERDRPPAGDPAGAEDAGDRNRRDEPGPVDRRVHAEHDRHQGKGQQAGALRRPGSEAAAAADGASRAVAISQAASAARLAARPSRPRSAERLVHVPVGVAALGRLVAEAQLCLGKGTRSGAREPVLAPHVERARPVDRAHVPGLDQPPGLVARRLLLAGQVVPAIRDRAADPAVAERKRHQDDERHGRERAECELPERAAGALRQRALARAALDQHPGDQEQQRHAEQRRGRTRRRHPRAARARRDRP